MRFAVLALVACGPRAAPVDRPAPSREAAPSACPLVIYPDQAWAHEVFPGCPDMPFTPERLPVCTGACPHACRTITGARSFAISYDGEGRWVESRLESSTDTSDLLSIRCTYDGDRLASCTRRYLGNVEWTDKLERDDAGRLIRVVNDQQTIEIRRDAGGRPIAIAGASGVDPHPEVHLAYDDRGRIVREQVGERIVNYGYTGERWTERRDDVALEQLRYDGDRLVSVATRGHGGTHAELRIAYDSAGRVRLVTRGDETTTYQYDCH